MRKSTIVNHVDSRSRHLLLTERRPTFGRRYYSLLSQTLTSGVSC